ncbi:site-specific integrase, partial [Salmonella enterica subsp. enterica serovar Istanbul]|nr:site-specific integrase [Salmonella enterica subsp. enterica serovar Istanbul]
REVTTKKVESDAGRHRLPLAHWLRRSHASHGLDRGAPIHLVQVLSHASLATTSRYTHAKPNEGATRSS